MSSPQPDDPLCLGPRLPTDNASLPLRYRPYFPHTHHLRCECSAQGAVYVCRKRQCCVLQREQPTSYASRPRSYEVACSGRHPWPKLIASGCRSSFSLLRQMSLISTRRGRPTRPCSRTARHAPTVTRRREARTGACTCRPLGGNGHWRVAQSLHGGVHDARTSVAGGGEGNVSLVLDGWTLGSDGRRRGARSLASRRPSMARVLSFTFGIRCDSATARAARSASACETHSHTPRRTHAPLGHCFPPPDGLAISSSIHIDLISILFTPCSFLQHPFLTRLISNMTRRLTGQPPQHPEFPFPHVFGAPPPSPWKRPTKPRPTSSLGLYRFHPRQRNHNLPSSPFELSLEFQRRQRSHPPSRGPPPRVRSTLSPLSPLQPLSPISVEEVLASSPEPSPTSPPLGEYPFTPNSSRYKSRRPSSASSSSRRPSTDVDTPASPASYSPRAVSPYLDSPYYSASPILSYRQLHPGPCYQRILDRRAELRDPANQPNLLSNLQSVARPITPIIDMANAPLKRKVVILGSPSVGE